MRRPRQRIGGILFQRTALPKTPQDFLAAEIGKLRDGQMSLDIVFRDPYLLDLVGLKGAYSERDLESAILGEIEGVLLELGTGFALVARQSRKSVLSARKNRSASSCARRPTPSRSSCSGSTPSPSASASTSRSCDRRRCCASGCTSRSRTPGTAQRDDCPMRRAARDL